MNKDHIFRLFEPYSTFHVVLVPNTCLHVDEFSTEGILNLWWMPFGLTHQDTEEISSRNTKKEEYVGPDPNLSNNKKLAIPMPCVCINTYQQP